ncbi:MAG: thermonuclease family protein [Desulfuromonadaceae bacterium]|nr:thermonuclease family protein [Desulfuromonadaceae bacterium]
MRLMWFPLLLLLAVATCGFADEFRGRVSWIYDGDTIEVEGVGRVRLLGIDTPEASESQRDLPFLRLGNIPAAGLRTAAEQIRNELIRTLKGQSVRVESTPLQRDRYQRLLGYVWLKDGRLLNQWLIEQGWARVYRRFDFSRKQPFLASEDVARRKKKGLWNAP